MISVITATFNAAAHLRHCFASIAGQTLACEHIIVDGASTDGTLAIIEEYVQAGAGGPQPPAPRFISEPDNDLYDALNKGIRMATGDVIGFLHGDDFYPTPDVLAKISRVFEDPAVDSCYGDLLYVQPGVGGWGLGAGEIVRYWRSGPYSREKFKWGWMPPHPTFFVRRQVYEQYGLFNSDLGTAADYELMLRFLLKHKISCTYLAEVLVCMRVGGASNRSFSARLKANRMDRRAWEVNGLRPYPWTIAMKPLRKLPQWWRRP